MHIMMSNRNIDDMKAEHKEKLRVYNMGQCYISHIVCITIKYKNFGIYRYRLYFCQNLPITDH